MLIETGSVFIDTNNPEWKLAEGSGQRIFKSRITFSRPFKTPPDLQVSLTIFDIANSANARLVVSAADATTTGFDLVFSTFADSKIFGAGAAWTAYGL